MMPLRAVLAITEYIDDEINKEMYSIPHLQQQLILLYARYDMQDIEETQFLEQETELLRRLEVAKEREWEEILAEEDEQDEQD